MAASTKLPPTVRYAEAEYWESRYQREPSVFEWFFGHTALRRIIRAYISKKKPVLHVGCGTSNLQEGMAQSGYTIVNTDISKVVVSQMTERHARYTNMTYQLSDCRNMPEFMDCQFGAVLDKGTVDALLCCKQGTENVMRMLLEVYRVLQPGGNFLLVTLGDPTRRLPLLLDPRLQWKVSLLLLPKISAACQAYVDGKPINDTVRPVDADGPYEVLDPDTIVALPAGVQYSNFFFAYVCKKQPLQLPLAQGQKAQLPNGWVAGSKELFHKLQKELGLPEDLLVKGRRKRVVTVPAGSSASMTGLTTPPASAHTSSGASGAASVHTTPRKHERHHHSHANQQQQEQQQQEQQQQEQVQQQESTMGSTSVPGSSPLVQLQHRQQQAAAEAKLDELLVANSQQQKQQDFPQQLPAVPRVELLEVPARPASAPNLANMVLPVTPDTPPAGGPGLQRGATGPQVVQCQDDIAVPSLHHVPTGAVAVAGAAAGGTSAAAACATVLPPAACAAALPPAGASSSESPPDAAAVAGAAAAAVAAGDGAMEAAGPAAGAVAADAAEDSAGQESDVVLATSLDTRPGVQQQPGVAAGAGGTAPAEQWSMLGRPSAAEAAATAAGVLPIAGAPLIPLLPRPGAAAAGRVPKLRRFSTDSPSIPMAALSPQLALLRMQQALHSERAADGLVMHDVAASEAYGGGGAAAAVAAAMVWGRIRPPRGRRLSGMSAVSNCSYISSTSMSVNEGDEDSELTDEFVSMCATGDSQLVEVVAEGVSEDEGGDEAAGSEVTITASTGDSMQLPLSSSSTTAAAAAAAVDGSSLVGTLEGSSPYSGRVSPASARLSPLGTTPEQPSVLEKELVEQQQQQQQRHHPPDGTQQHDQQQERAQQLLGQQCGSGASVQVVPVVQKDILEQDKQPCGVCASVQLTAGQKLAEDAAAQTTTVPVQPQQPQPEQQQQLELQLEQSSVLPAC